MSVKYSRAVTNSTTSTVVLTGSIDYLIFPTADKAFQFAEISSADFGNRNRG